MNDSEEEGFCASLEFERLVLEAGALPHRLRPSPRGEIPSLLQMRCWMPLSIEARIHGAETALGRSFICSCRSKPPKPVAISVLPCRRPRVRILQDSLFLRVGMSISDEFVDIVGSRSSRPGMGGTLRSFPLFRSRSKSNSVQIRLIARNVSAEGRKRAAPRAGRGDMVKPFPLEISSCEGV